MANKILNMELSEEDASLLKESLTAWKEEVYAGLIEKVEEEKTQKIEELEEANRQYQSEVKEEFAEKMVSALNEMRTDLRAEILSEMVSCNPELQILERVKELIAPTLNEEYYGNVFAEEIQSLREENENLKREAELDEGADALAELISPYSEKTQNIVLAMIKEGNAEEVTEQFYELIESLGEATEEDEPEEDDDEVEYDEDGNVIEPDDYDGDDDEVEYDEDGNVIEPDEEDGEVDESYIDEGVEEEEVTTKRNSFLNEIAGLAK